MRVLVCGRRSWTNPLPIWIVLQGLKVETNETDGRLTVIEGGAKGADAIAGRWADSQPDVDHIVVPAEWDRYGRAAGPRRNAQMLELEPQLVVAFGIELWPSGNGGTGTGTEDMMKRAAMAGVQVWMLGAVYPYADAEPTLWQTSEDASRISVENMAKRGFYHDFDCTHDPCECSVEAS